MAPKRSLMLAGYGVALNFVGPASAGLLLRVRTARGREDAARLGERRGTAALARPAGALMWIHAASIGELVSMLPIVEALTTRGFAVLVTTGTVTSAQLAAERLPAGALHQYVPLDVPRYVRRFLDHWRPDLALFAESELWPAMIGELARRRVPLVLANARMSARSYRRWQIVPAAARALLGRIELCLAQSDLDARRLATLGAPRVEVAGNLKLDVPPPPAAPEAVFRLRQALGRRPMWLAASTHPGEEEMVARVHSAVREAAPGLLTVIVPRHPERGAAVAAIAQAGGLAAEQRTAAAVPAAATEIYVADTIGELGLFFRLAEIAFLGGSLVPHGGQNPIEPAKLGAAILHGPHVANFAELYAALDHAAGAREVAGGDALAQQLTALVADAPARQAMREAAAAVVGELGGALARTMAALEPYLMQLRLGRRC
jgi:3-deoxy-D-manno-octulosonic-acid transferase